jgi:hypothetical protein
MGGECSDGERNGDGDGSWDDGERIGNDDPSPR